MMDENNLKKHYSLVASQAHRQCNDAHYERALANYQQCLLIARQLQDDEKMAANYSWIAECLRKLNRHDDALLMLAPNLSKYAKGDPKEIYNSMTTYIGIALELPAEKSLIAGAIDETRAYLVNIGRLEWEHSLMLLEAIFLEEQGLITEALERGQQAWAIWRQQYPYFTADSHYFQLIMVQIRLQNLENAKSLLAQWEENQANTHPTTRMAQMYQVRSYLSRLERDYETTIRYAEQAVHFAQKLEVPRDYAQALHILAWAQILTDNFALARQTIAKIPLIILKKKKYSITGDFHLMHARHLCGLPVIDPVFTARLPEISNSIDLHPALPRELHRAGLAYQFALNRARMIDKAFGCSWRQDAIQARINHIQALTCSMGYS